MLIKYKEETKKAYDQYAELYDQKFGDYLSRYNKPLADQFIAQLMGKKILDLGCGPCNYSRYFKQQGLDVLGVDYSEQCVTICRHKGIKAILADFEELAIPKEKFDGMWANAAIVHTPKSQIERVFKHVTRLLKPKTGLLHLSVKEGTTEGFETRPNQPGVQRWFAHFSNQEVTGLLKSQYKVISHSRTNVEDKFFFLEYLARKK